MRYHLLMTLSMSRIPDIESSISRTIAVSSRPYNVSESGLPEIISLGASASLPTACLRAPLPLGRITDSIAPSSPLARTIQYAAHHNAFRLSNIKVPNAIPNGIRLHHPARPPALAPEVCPDHPPGIRPGSRQTATHNAGRLPSRAARLLPYSRWCSPGNPLRRPDGQASCPRCSFDRHSLAGAAILAAIQGRSESRPNAPKMHQISASGI
jgi:hypothetical protein